MRVFNTVMKQGWYPILITALAVVGYINDWPIAATASVLVIILVIGLVMTAASASEKELELSSIRLRELAGYFYRRFAGSSSLSIFAIIDTLFNIDNPKLWEWARACDISQRIFDTWCGSFISRVESDVKTRRFNVYLRTYLNELWLLNSRYYEFVEQFYEVAEQVEVPRETVDQYNRFVMEYNVFVQDFQESISELKRVTRTEIEPPSVKLAGELPTKKSLQATEEKPPPTTEHKGYIM